MGKKGNRMQDKVCIITGGASGMGYATAKLFASEGAKLVLADINEEQGEKVAEEIRAGGTECIFQKCNIALEADTKALADVAVKTFGRIDSLISFAGLGANPIAFKKLVKDYEGGTDEKAEEIVYFQRVWEYSQEDWDRMINVNLGGVYQLSKAIVPIMIEQKSGNIVWCSSLNALQAIPNADNYTAAKGGVTALTRSMAMNLGPCGIRVNAICPGLVATPLHGTEWKGMIGQDPGALGLYTSTPINRPGLAEEIAGPALFLANDEEASFVTGVNLCVDGGWNCL